MEGSIFKEIMTDHVDDNGAVHMDGYKTGDSNETGVVIGVVINGEVYWRDPEYQFDPYVKEVVEEIKEKQKLEVEKKRVSLGHAIQFLSPENDHHLVDFAKSEAKEIYTKLKELL